VPSGPSRCELGQSGQAETHPCRASGSEAGNQSRQGIQTVPCHGEVFEPPAALDKMTPFCRDLCPWITFFAQCLRRCRSGGRRPGKFSPSRAP
jgi:hypothetical protein